jgi:hypothetical protein
MFEELKKYIAEQQASNKLQAPAPQSDDNESLGERLRRLGPPPSLEVDLGGKASTTIARESQDATRDDRISQIARDVAKEKRDAAQATAPDVHTERGRELIKNIFMGAGLCGIGAAITLALVKYFG